jgi:acyl transferase domain-containing protein
MSQDSKTTERRELLKAAFLRIEELESRLASAETRAHAPIAVVGLGCRFPAGANSPSAFWDLLRSGVDAISEVPRDRWNLEEYYDADPDAPGKMYARGGGFLDQVDLFDPQFFGIAPREAASIDPQQRLLLEVTWEALEHGGIAPLGLNGTATGVFIGLTTDDYSRLQARAGEARFIDAYFGTGVAASVAAGRLSYVLGLRGPSLTIDTACSSSLVAVHLASQSLRGGECRLALAGGVNLMLSPEGHIVASKGRMLAPDSRCKTFDARADGYVRSEGCGMVVLKRLADARADGDSIFGVIRGTAINQDGRSSGLTAPNGRAQEEVMRAALADAALPPDEVTYVETHGTGTSLGDPIEVHALGAVQGAQRSPDNPLLIGSVKSNIGHLEAAAGVAGLIKAVLALHHSELPPHLHFTSPNPYIPWAELPIAVANRRMPWPEGRPRVVGVSSFGFSGTNAHVVLEGAPIEEPREAPLERPVHLLSLSGRTPEALRDLAARYVEVLERADAAAFADICFTAAAGRSHAEQRLAVPAGTSEEALQKLRAFVDGKTPSGLWSGEAALKRPPQVAFLFTGQGAQYANMARGLYETQPTFRAALDRCDGALSGALEASLVSTLFPAPGDEASVDERLRQTAWTQPALFAVEYALAELWQSWGIRPAAVMGHSIGEFVAACVAGVFSLQDAIGLIAERGRLMQRLPTGGVMAAVAADERRVASVVGELADRVAIAGINGPTQTVVSGEGVAVEQLLARLASDGIQAQRLTVSHAFHSPLVEPMLDDFERAARRVQASDPQIALVSNLTGRAIERGQELDPSYWRLHARHAVRFSDSLATMYELGCRVFLEIGPQPTLMALGLRSLERPDVMWVGSLRRGQDDCRHMLGTLAALYVAGVPVDWAAFDRDYSRRKVQIPTYPFQRERHWVEMPVSGRAEAGSERPAGRHPLLGRRLASPRLTDIVFETELSPDGLSAIRDHRIFGRVIVPAAAYLEMAAAAATSVFGAGMHSVEDLVIHEPIILDESQRRAVQVVLGSPDERWMPLEIYSRVASDGASADQWTLHAKGRIGRTADDAETEPPNVPQAEMRNGEMVIVAPATYYDRLSKGGVEYGPAFRGLGALERADGQTAATLVIPACIESEVDQYGLHPALLDACFQALGLALPGGADPAASPDVYLPVQVGRYRQFGRAEREMRVLARMDVGGSPTAETFVGSVILSGANGKAIAQVDGLRFKRASRAALRRAAGFDGVDELLCEIEWQQLADVNGVPARSAHSGPWIVFSDAQGVGDALISELASAGADCVRVFRSDAYTGPSRGEARVRVGAAEDFARLVLEVGARGAIAGVVHLWNLDLGSAGPGAPADLEHARAIGCVSLLHVVQALASREDFRASVTVVTRGAQPADEPAGAVSILQAPAWGLGKVIAAEHPDLRARLVDLDEAATSTQAAAQLARELTGGESHEHQVAFRGGRRLGARLIRRRAGAEPHQGLPVPVDERFGLQITQRGMLENLRLAPIDTHPPGPGEIQIRVEASGLNFRDVLSALGMYPGEPGPLGGEAVGIVAAVGPGVTRFAVGDPILALTPRGFCSIVNTSEQLAWHRPRGMSVVQAATIPLVFQTAHYALNHLARMRRGERVLIHAGAGGVGLAAIQLARIAGAEIFATAGTPQKRELLRSLGVEHVMDSRSLAFADEIMAVTNGEGVDIVLNSLAGEFIPSSLGVLRAGGRFLELGKTDVWDGARAARVNPGASYAAVYLGDVCHAEPALIEKMFGELMAWFDAGQLKPLPHRTWPIDRADEAFRFMAQAKHVGKIVIEQVTAADRPIVRPDGAYLITGGLGGLGLAVARWLADRGARDLTLVGRRPPDGAALDAVHALEADGVQVTTAAADVADPAAMRQVFAALDSRRVTLRGVIHAAGVLDDGLLVQQDARRFAAVMRPKIDGAWNLHVGCAGRELDFFALFSAGAALFGSPAQGNYAAANAFLDALAWARRDAGQPGVSINWGPWQETGMAARLGGRERERWASHGVGMIDTERGLAAFERVLKRGRPQTAVLPIDWSRFLAQWAAGSEPAFFRAVAERPPAQAPTATERDTADVLQIIDAAPVDDRRTVLESHVRDQVSRVLGIAATSLRGDRGFAELGMDSLMSVELSNRLKRSLKRQLPATLAFEQPTIDVLTGYLAGLLGLRDPLAPAEAVEPESVMRKELLEDVERLSEDEAEASLARELDRAGY